MNTGPAFGFVRPVNFEGAGRWMKDLAQGILRGCKNAFGALQFEGVGDGQTT